MFNLIFDGSMSRLWATGATFRWGVTVRDPSGPEERRAHRPGPGRQVHDDPRSDPPGWSEKAASGPVKGTPVRGSRFVKLYLCRQRRTKRLRRNSKKCMSN